MRNAVAFANNDVATIAWSYGTRPDGCMGFALYRIDGDGKETVLHSFSYSDGDGTNPEGNLLEVNNELYGTTSGGGANSGGAVFKVKK